MGTEFEKDFDDEVYEDDFYEDGYEGEELVEDDDEGRSADDGDDDLDGDDKRIDVSFACEDCDYRWEDQITKKKDEIDDIDFSDIVCPMCGSVNITQI
ncbi:MAG TPA: hypothetical protein PKM65_12595 [Spirochaetota bacterium]|nr:hypothetical protein [Spirochaetota bacterium]HNT10322.1 hypothetical protein [Spirochaetota bacterium]HNV46131.1 hypothetical protein [Spirochaetota bacterium]HOS39881.1 hypothetical protein [Spirochaetota bacterium]HPU90076.1 hypothetical protein [Spirochaetota bacterium]